MTTLTDWNPTCHTQPDVRVAIVLPQDGATTIQLQLPDTGCDLSNGSDVKPSVSGLNLTARLSEPGVSLRVADQDQGTAYQWSVVPQPGSNPGTPPTVRVDNIIAGRGFHWQKATTQHLPGALTLTSRDDALLLTCRLPIEEYLLGVITSEMGGRCPVEFLKAQCVVARSWTLAAVERKHADLDVDLCNDDCCQRFQGLTNQNDSARQAVRQTYGQVLLAEDGRVVDANYSKSCGGIVETPEKAFGVSKPGLGALVDAPPTSRIQSHLPLTETHLEGYLTGRLPGLDQAYCSPSHVPEADLPGYLGPVDTGQGFFRWTVSHSREQLEETLRRKNVLSTNPGELHDIEVTHRGTSGRAISVDLVFAAPGGQHTTRTIHGEYNIRNALSDSFLYSSAIWVRAERDASGRALRFHFDGAGWGHGVGMCQIGALGMALAGRSSDEILEHYFPTARLARVYDG